MSTAVSKKAPRIATFLAVAVAALFRIQSHEDVAQPYERELMMQAGFIKGGPVTVQPIREASKTSTFATASVMPSVPSLAEILPQPIATRAETNPGFQQFVGLEQLSATYLVSEFQPCEASATFTGGMATCSAGDAVQPTLAGEAAGDPIAEDKRLSFNLLKLSVHESFTSTLDDGLDSRSALTVVPSAALGEVVLQWHDNADTGPRPGEFQSSQAATAHFWSAYPHRGEDG